MTEPSLDEDSAEPLHHQLQRILIHKIESGELAPGDKLTGEVTISEQYGVSRATVRQAILALVQKDYLTRKQGKGTFVARQKYDMSVLDLRFSASTNAQHELVGVDRDVRLPKVSRRLGLDDTDRLIVTRRVRLENNEPVALETAHLSGDRFDGLEKSDFTLPLLDILRADYGVSIRRYSATIEPVLLDESERENLKYDDDPPLGLLVTRIGFAADETPILLSKSTFRGDLCRAIFNN